MQRNFPSPIMNENDLNLYQNYLNDDTDMDMDMQEQQGTPMQQGMSMQQGMPVRQNMPMPQPISVDVVENNMSFIPSNNSYVPETLRNTSFLPAYLTKQIGKLMRIEFLLGNQLETRIGWLMTVGASYIVLKLYQESTTMACDIYSIKFVTIIHDNDLNKLPLR